MRRAISQWLGCAHRRRWGWRDYAKHFGLVMVLVWVPTMHWIAIMSNS